MSSMANNTSMDPFKDLLMPLIDIFTTTKHDWADYFRQSFPKIATPCVTILFYVSYYSFHAPTGPSSIELCLQGNEVA
jgi:hypothetical protein